MTWEDFKKQLPGAIVGACITGAITLGTITSKIEQLNTSFNEYKVRMDERHEVYKETLANVSQELKTIKQQQ